MKNRRWLLASHPEGRTKIEDFTLDEEEISSPPPADHVIIKNKLVSVDPYQRGRISGVDGYAKSYEKGTLVKSLGVGEVVESSSSLLNVGDFVFGEIGWQEYSVLPAKFLRKIDPAVCSPLSLALGPLGMVGMTAYFGFVDICNPKEGETVLVSAAAGAVGSLVGQIAKIFGCRVVGTTSSDEKAEFLKSIGYDEVVNYKTCGNLKEAISRACPKGIDIYFDNVGGETLNIAVSLLNRFGRISLCGGISQYDGDYSAGPNITSLIGKEAKIQGFIVGSMFGQRFPEGMAKMGEWVQAGKIQFRETKFEGIESAPKAFISLFESANIGKVVVYI